MTCISIFLPRLNDEARTRAEEAFRIITEQLGGHILGPNLQHDGLSNGANTCGAGKSTVSSTGIAGKTTAGKSTATLTTVPLTSSGETHSVESSTSSQTHHPSWPDQSTFGGPAQQDDGQSGSGNA